MVEGPKTARRGADIHRLCAPADLFSKGANNVADIETTHTGGCLCEGVRYRIRGALRGVIACHCSQCRRTSGHYAAMTSAPSADIELTASDSLLWYKSSDTAERGFCRVCGGNLFWKQAGRDAISITAGT